MLVNDLALIVVTPVVAQNREGWRDYRIGWAGQPLAIVGTFEIKVRCFRPGYVDLV